MRNIFLEKLNTKCGGESIPISFSKKSKLSISLIRFKVFMQFVFIVCHAEGYGNISKLSCGPLAFTSYKAFL